jgi:hypothetical protein
VKYPRLPVLSCSEYEEEEKCAAPKVEVAEAAAR